MEKETEEKLIQLETKIAYLEDFVNQLQAVAVENSATIEKLREENKLMSQKIRELSDQMEGDIPNRRPPHYQGEKHLLSRCPAKAAESKLIQKIFL